MINLQGKIGQNGPGKPESGKDMRMAKQSRSQELDRFAGIQYAGIGGASKDCQDAVLRFLQFGTPITHCAILSAGRDHCLLLRINEGDQVAIKSGFASGYGGEGPRTFSYVLQTLQRYGVEIQEFEVEPAFIERLDASALTQSDMDALGASHPVRPTRWHDYLEERHWKDSEDGSLWQREFPLVIPFAVIDPRLMDLALDFWNEADARLLDGYRRLEDILRTRTGLATHGSKLFSQTFHPENGALTWTEADEGERSGRMQLFTGTFAAHRNPRAHRERKERAALALREFLLLNHLYVLEAEAVPNPHARNA
jgi:hypothetical protein